MLNSIVHFEDQLTVISIHLLFFVGIIGFISSYFVSKIPVIPYVGQIDFVSTKVFGIAPVATIIRIMSIIVFLIGLYYEGGLAAKERYENQIALLELKVHHSEMKSKDLNQMLEKKIEPEIVYVEQKKRTMTEIVQKNKEVIDRECKLDPLTIKILNSAAKSEKK